MPTVAEQLREARERRRWTIQDAADATKIKSDHLRALEEGNWRTFTAPVYLRGFVRSYSGHLQLDVAAVLRDLETEISKSRQFAEPMSLMPRKRGPLDWVMLWLTLIKWRIAVPLVVTLMVAGAVYYGLKTYRSRPQPVRSDALSGGMYRPAQTLPANTIPLPTNLPPPAVQPMPNRNR